MSIDPPDEALEATLAERVAQAKEELLALVSHDLRGPLNAIAVALDGLRDPAVDATARERYIAAIARSVTRADRLLHDLVTAHELATGKLEIRPAPVPVRALLEQVAREHESMAAQARTQIVVEVEPGAETLSGDRDRISQALGCLIANALRHGRGGSVIELVARPGASVGSVVLGVRDHGPGLPADGWSHVFDADWPGRKKRGGLGLSIVRGIARGHGGEAQAAQAPGGGALFLMELPAAR